jgi:DNA repair protein SbcC/Rad50
MIPRRIVLENFLSFGSPETVIEFSDDESLWVLGGRNGAGKSAVFDAMTYALYAEHRGGATDHTSLIRHGTNGFRVVFEFEFNGAIYRITRNRPLRGRPTQTIEQWVDDGWNESIQLPPAAGRQDPVRLWAERTLGLGFDAFTASVLLRQGQADEIISATGSKRLAILKKIIGVERYEALSERVHSRFRSCKDRLADLCTRRDAQKQVTQDELQAVLDEFARAEEVQSRAQEAVAGAVERVPLARQWVKLETESRTLAGEIRQADARATDAARIRGDYARLNDLSAAMPLLRQIVSINGRFSDAPDALARMHDEERQRLEELDQLTAAIVQEKQKAEGHRLRAEDETRKAEHLRGEIKRAERLINPAIELATLDAALKAFPPDLADQLHGARERVRTAADTLTAAGQSRATLAGFLEEAEGQKRRFETLGVGVACSLCGQPVSEKHAEDERARLADKVRKLGEDLRQAAANEQTADAEKKAAEAEQRRLDVLHRQQTEKSQQLATLRQMLGELGETRAPDELRRDVAAKSEAAGSHGRNTQAEEQGRQFAEAEAGRLENSRQSTATKLFTALNAERQQLADSGVPDRFRQLEQDAARREGCAERLAEVTRQIEEIPAASRISEKEAERQLATTRQIATAADKARDAAKKKSDDLATEAENFRKLTEEVALAEKQSDLHRKLDELLGKAGLQRELVRSAEKEIVRLANDTLQALSDGDLTVELDDSEAGDDEAFALRIRRADGPTPIGVSYLSGSQKFRVAISVALAIGRYAAGQARPLESVIIDEGFGSLDRDGLRAAAAELNRLRQHLRRIILVSHQEEFARQFPVVIQLTQGETGTTAAAVRQ